MSGDNVLAILAMAAATYATRASGLVIGDYLPRHGAAKRALDALPVAVLTAVVTPVVLSGRAEFGAGLIAAGVAMRYPLLATLIAGMAAAAALRQFL